MKPNLVRHPDSTDEAPRFGCQIAEEVAHELIELFDGCYVEGRMEPWGSIRRKKGTVKDVELGYMPIMVDAYDEVFTDMVIGQNSLFRKRADELVQLGILTKRLNKHGNVCSWGQQNLMAIYRGIPIDFFGVLKPEAWGVQKLIRTGPEEYTRGFVTPRDKGGTVLLAGMHVREGCLWRFGDVVPCYEEEDFYNAVKRPYAAPEVRFG